MCSRVLLVSRSVKSWVWAKCYLVVGQDLRPSQAGPKSLLAWRLHKTDKPKDDSSEMFPGTCRNISPHQNGGYRGLAAKLLWLNFSLKKLDWSSFFRDKKILVNGWSVHVEEQVLVFLEVVVNNNSMCQPESSNVVYSQCNGGYFLILSWCPRCSSKFKILMTPCEHNIHRQVHLVNALANLLNFMCHHQQLHDDTFLLEGRQDGHAAMTSRRNWLVDKLWAQYKLYLEAHPQ
ncbi:hypothetical protein VP01_2268g2 [Puccinia sorghi]|uniref:Uncharacterized protein n=1 Tax=Puccinia sorghi TaxID=27349 RepID=A0A0L6V869_9BASI|nr:hypothetical protein VP01_2268g2 [Puccinia sorghi]